MVEISTRLIFQHQRDPKPPRLLHVVPLMSSSLMTDKPETDALSRRERKTVPPATFSDLGALAVGSLTLPMLLAKATIVLVVALGITMAMQRASAGARHLVWLVTLGTLLLVPALSAWAPLRLAILPAPPAPAPAPA